MSFEVDKPISSAFNIPVLDVCPGPTVVNNEKILRFEDRPSFSKILSNQLLSIVRGFRYPYRFKDFSPFGKYQYLMKRFLCAIDAYIESPKSRLDPNEIIERSISEGPAYAQFLKRLKRKSFLISNHAHLFEEPDWWDSIPSILISDVGEIFNYQYLFPWADEDEGDYKHGFIPFQEELDFSDFQKMLRAILPDVVEEVHKEEILLEVSGSSSLNRNSLHSNKNYILKQTDNTISDEIGLCARTLIQVAPCGARDTVILNPSALNRVKWIDKQVRVILEELGSHIHISSESIIDKRLKDLSRRFSLFLHRDLKKEGITKPRELLKVTLEVLYEKYGFEAFNSPNFYDSFQLYKDGEIIKPIRGHGLGMANALTTLIQITTAYMSISKASDYKGEEIESDFLALNDDFVIGFNNHDDLEQYWEAEDEVLDNLGLIREPDKSFWLERTFTLAERYISDEKDLYKKDSYYRREFLNAFSAYNITHAKSITSSLILSDIDYQERYLKELVSFWGYEFYPEEYEYPALFGGWFSFGYKSISLDLYLMDKLDYIQPLYGAYKACMENSIKKYFREKQTYQSPLMKVYPLMYMKLEEDYRTYFDADTLGAVKTKYFRVNERHEGIRLWNLLYKKRRKIFLGNSFKVSKRSLMEYVYTSSSKEFYPPDSMISGFEKVEDTDCPYKDWYFTNNPRLSYLQSLGETNRKGIIADKYSILGFQPARLTPNDLRKRLKGVIGSRMIPIFNDRSFNEDMYLYEGVTLDENYRNPQDMCKLASYIREDNLVPLPRWKAKGIKEKKAIYGCFLTTQQIKALQPYQLDRKRLKPIVQMGLLDLFLFDRESWELTLENNPGMRKREKKSALVPKNQPKEDSEDPISDDDKEEEEGSDISSNSEIKEELTVSYDNFFKWEYDPTKYIVSRYTEKVFESVSHEIGDYKLHYLSFGEESAITVEYCQDYVVRRCINREARDLFEQYRSWHIANLTRDAVPDDGICIFGDD
jgi:hypothetical protein